MSCSSAPREVEIFDRYYSTFDLGDIPSSTTADKTLDTAHQAYQDEEFDVVERLTTSYITENGQVPLVMMAQAVAFTEVGKYEQAETNFRTLSAHPYLGTPAAWYLALLQIRRGDFQAAQGGLTSIVERGDSPEYGLEARELLAEIGERTVRTD